MNYKSNIENRIAELTKEMIILNSDLDSALSNKMEKTADSIQHQITTIMIIKTELVNLLK